ncbi:carbohydrate kinase, thermoresistant glucokinase family [Hoeflea sp. IMCC20628]|uniref:gluconokinase n=1 Tax=Hoeflea sp. IMCC20628 TaxID=1620421 RepID=UPI00063BE09B|nr:gluconokinase, GntK/IdnK-type [Hoeflea sp. IMCC20628]AKI02525.1 carbohydrate kinase, thermoresistant glucokinase family [Hoeflea sp. IMCC20628]
MAGQSTGKVLIAMGVCGAGKSALARTLSARLDLALVDADDHHSETARAAMSRGDALSDAERLPWLDRVAAAAEAAAQARGGVVIACSALRRIYRDRLRSHLPSACFIHLSGERDLIASRLAARRDHFVGLPLLDSQLATLEPLGTDENGMTVDVTASIELLSEAVLRKMGDAAAASLETGPGPDTIETRQN